MTKAVGSFTILAQQAVAQRVKTTLPLTYPGQVLQEDGSQTCPSEARQEIIRNEVENALQSLLQESVVSLLQLQSSCGGHGFGWRHVAYICMAGDHHPTQGVWEKIL